jgi:hypothetical protein
MIPLTVIRNIMPSIVYFEPAEVINRLEGPMKFAVNRKVLRLSRGKLLMSMPIEGGYGFKNAWPAARPVYSH